MFLSSGNERYRIEFILDDFGLFFEHMAYDFDGYYSSEGDT